VSKVDISSWHGVSETTIPTRVPTRSFHDLHPRKDKKGETKWTSTGEAELVSAFEEARKEGLQADSGWKPTAWQRVVHALAGSEKISGGAVKEVDACMRRDDSHDDARVKFIENLFYCYTTEICVRCKSRGNFTQESYRNLHLRESR
jgi:hypothetical protein